jgi:transcription antitermination factor NusG
MSKKWFVIHARSGYEAKVKIAIEEAVAREGLEEFIGEIMIPTEQVVELKGGKKKRKLSVSFFRAICWFRWSLPSQVGC